MSIRRFATKELKSKRKAFSYGSPWESHGVLPRLELTQRHQDYKLFHDRTLSMDAGNLDSAPWG